MLDLKNYHFDKKYDDISDEELIKIIKSGDKDALNYLIHRYKNVVTMKTNKFFAIGAEKEDMVQEGYWGLYKAIKSFEHNITIEDPNQTKYDLYNIFGQLKNVKHRFIIYLGSVVLDSRRYYIDKDCNIIFTDTKIHYKQVLERPKNWK